jgi:hypothetical protein
MTKQANFSSAVRLLARTLGKGRAPMMVPYARDIARRFGGLASTGRTTVYDTKGFRGFAEFPPFTSMLEHGARSQGPGLLSRVLRHAIHRGPGRSHAGRIPNTQPPRIYSARELSHDPRKVGPIMERARASLGTRKPVSPVELDAALDRARVRVHPSRVVASLRSMFPYS